MEYWCFVILFASFLASSTAELVLVHVLYRHGDRAPTQDDDLSQLNVTWPEGFGELTKLGLDEHFQLGQFLRKEYIETGFLNATYSTPDIFVRSTDYNRTLMSAQANLAGFYYPPTPGTYPDSWKTNYSLTWRPIPVHTVNKMQDPLLWMNCPCKKYDRIYQEVTHSEPFISEAKEFLKNMSKWTNNKDVNVTNIWRIHDPLKVETIYGLPRPDWCTDEVYNLTDEVNDLGSRYLFHDEELTRLRGGLLLKEIVKRMKQKADGSLGWTIKYYAYSAHDLTLVAFLESLRVYWYDGRMPSYASTVAVELHMEKGKAYVKVRYLYSADYNGFVDLTNKVPGCDKSTALGCELETFDKSVQKYMFEGNTIEDWMRECREEPSVVQFDWRALAISMCVLTIFFGFWSLVFAVLFFRARQNENLFEFPKDGARFAERGAQGSALTPHEYSDVRYTPKRNDII